MNEGILMLKPKNWQQFQHYKDRCPPWLKLHRDLLNNKDFMRLPTASKALAPMFWLLASESRSLDGIFDASDDELEFRLRMPVSDIQTGRKSLIDNGFFHVASGVLAECLQPAIPEESRGEKSKEDKTGKVSPPDGVSIKVWADFVKLRKSMKAPITDTAIDGVRREAAKVGYTLEQALTTCIERSWRGFKAEWITAKPESSVSNVMRGVI